jgi:hypothetical protein
MFLDFTVCNEKMIISEINGVWSIDIHMHKEIRPLYHMFLKKYKLKKITDLNGKLSAENIEKNLLTTGLANDVLVNTPKVQEKAKAKVIMWDSKLKRCTTTKRMKNNCKVKR